MDFKILTIWHEALSNEARRLGYINSWNRIAWGEFMKAIAIQILEGKIKLPPHKPD
ncbi:hypothetical protein S7335_1315 [Synechococcus sp. PCC 7335]|uniref:hypothetical protein n=1 Tax=Synechococcus sp. (strain ATCC 29403 / PCC 7335) TaxID=91464 RepID=UPI00017EB91A|nr:hypothetical protein [Synechococcus sp. PCC 7335]EDX82611.1 hypothetical protein S7335_1315 [Synechococcus sp. PCC 7335]